jgi:predicted lipoprotein with Yx(FWY)xxD motif
MNFGRAKLLLPVLAGVGLLAGCGSSSSSSSSSSAASSTSSQASSPASAPAASAVEITTKPAKKLGMILAAGHKELTVYMFEADKGGKSACTGKCAHAWPPVLGKPTAAGKAVSGDLGTVTRSDGKTQVTYKGHPLYLFVKDKDNADAYGQGSKAFGASWYALNPSGKKIDNS